ncbi:MAG: recombination mediator RecR [Prevotella sp.]|nr:recombination mediator RecR [Prevotella sp.]
MINQTFPSKLLEDAVGAFQLLPGIGRKTATRLVLHLLKQDQEEVKRFTDSILRARNEIRYCRRCHNISDADLCPICANPRRDATTLCVVENIQDVLAIENTQQYLGLYHVLGGIISPMDGVGPSDITIDSLVERVATGEVKEVIFALSPTMEGDTTNFFIQRKLAPYKVRTTVIARGIAVGDELEYADEVTLGRAIANRIDL